VFPYHDENQTQRTAIVTLAIIALCTLAWLFVQGAGASVPLATAVCNLGLIPGELTGMLRAGVGFDMGEGLVCVTDPGRQTSHILTSMFLHGGWMHLIGNMWFLWLFGNNIEDSMTRPRFVIFYLASGLAAAFAQVATDGTSIIPMVGASGAISGVMGAYLILYPTVRVYALLPLGFLLTTVSLPAWGMLLYWAFLQFASRLVDLAGSQGGGGVAFWAHIGGFVAGIVLAKIFARSDYIAAHRAHHWQPRRMGWR
jgi:membrane associated rhomboid family serine protease